MEEWLERFLYVALAVILPLALIGVGAILDFGGVLLIIVLVAWMGFAIVLFSPFLA